eukprot:Sspe_Gene.76342::Locus_47698_Transcript_1_1_Confidence_1.000_Length_1318::g.76342::m.76342
MWSPTSPGLTWLTEPSPSPQRHRERILRLWPLGGLELVIEETNARQKIIEVQAKERTAIEDADGRTAEHRKVVTQESIPPSPVHPPRQRPVPPDKEEGRSISKVRLAVYRAREAAYRSLFPEEDTGTLLRTTYRGGTAHLNSSNLRSAESYFSNLRNTSTSVVQAASSRAATIVAAAKRAEQQQREEEQFLLEIDEDDEQLFNGADAGEALSPNEIKFTSPGGPSENSSAFDVTPRRSSRSSTHDEVTECRAYPRSCPTEGSPRPHSEPPSTSATTRHTKCQPPPYNYRPPESSEQLILSDSEPLTPVIPLVSLDDSEITWRRDYHAEISVLRSQLRASATGELSPQWWREEAEAQQDVSHKALEGGPEEEGVAGIPGDGGKNGGEGVQQPGEPDTGE